MSTRSDGTFTVALAGDAIVNRRVSRLEGVDEVADRVRTADTAAVNLEVVPSGYRGYPKGLASGGITIGAPPWVLDELDQMGFGLFAAANNHITDFSHRGVEITIEELESRGLSYAGIGASLSEARSPAYLDTPAGRVALVSACSTIPHGAVAGEAGPDLPGRPGLSPLRFETSYTLPDDLFEAVGEISERLGLEEIKAGRSAPRDVTDPEGVHHFLDMGTGWAGTPIRFEAGEPGVRRTANEDDIRALTRQVDAAARQADWVIVSLHAHEGENGRLHDSSVAPFVEEFARDCVDAGADVFFAHGPHQIRGIEVYDGAPILYSLGDFMAQQETMTRLPRESYDQFGLDADALPADVFDERYFDDAAAGRNKFETDEFWESILAVPRFEDGGFDAVGIHPIELGADRRRPGRGVPRIARGDDADRILSRLADLSAPYGTGIEVSDGVGTVRP